VNFIQPISVLMSLLRKYHLLTVSRLAIDLISWSIAIYVTSRLRIDPNSIDGLRVVSKGMIIFAPLLISAGLTTGIYRRRYRYGSFEEMAALALSVSVSVLVHWAINAFMTTSYQIPKSSIIVGGAFGFLTMGATRYLWRLIIDTTMRPPQDQTRRTLVFGAGAGGTETIRSLLRNPLSPLFPVGILDDDPLKRRLRISGVPVLGDRQNISDVAASTKAEVFVIAIPSASADVISELVRIARENQLEPKVLPSVLELFGQPLAIGDIRDPTEEDLLGRHQIATDLQSISRYVTEKRILVTGAGGSIGSEICRQLLAFNPKNIYLLDRDESGLHQTRLSMYGDALLDTEDVVLVDIRDEEALDHHFSRIQPEVVFHAAALKHLPLLEQFPEEALKTNIYGTANLLRASVKFKVETFVNISTDKAANPSSNLGKSKFICEQLTASAAKLSSDTQYLSVRFGNVLGSRGSVLISFREQIRNGGPVTVTHPDVTRFFMTVSEAVQLVIQAGAIGRSGETLVLDMGKPVRILDVAQEMVRASKKPIEIVFTGLRAGEKLHEVLFSDVEAGARPIHPLVMHVSVEPLEVELLSNSEQTLLSLRHAFESL
jgi:FlaA1/EpsC-like NDP-sugar epimerase